MVGPVFMMCMVGLVYVGLMLFSYSSMQDAVQQSARCWAVNTTSGNPNSCGSSSSTQTYAATVYHGMSAPAPTFTATATTCGFQVTGTMSFKINWVLGKSTVPLSATACFP